MEQRRAHNSDLLRDPKRHQTLRPMGLHTKVPLSTILQLQDPRDPFRLGEPPGLENDPRDHDAAPRL